MIDFRRLRQLNMLYLELLFRVQRAEASATRVTSNITGMPRGGSGNHQEDAIINYVDVREAYREVLAELEQMRAEIRPLIDSIDNPNIRGVMRLRYMDGWTIDRISVQTGKGISTVYRYLQRGEQRIQKKISQNM